jgi:two-component system, NarL family, nitrate/nitrite response regulator NarL
VESAERRRVLVVDDHPVVRRGLSTVLVGEPWVADVVEASTVAGALEAVASNQVDLVSMDLSLPDGDGIEATVRILACRPATRVLILTMTDGEEVVVRALRAGASGYLLKASDPEEVISALRTVAAGGITLGAHVGPGMLAAIRESPATLPAPFDRLTAREREVLSRLSKGESNARIARHLGLSEKTVRNQLSVVFTKIGVSDRVQAALRARDAGLTPPD